jgi:phosphoribosylformylglycinamidine cyclo-ligase
LPDGLWAAIDLDTWELPPVFGWLRAIAGIADPEMLKTFNCGIGLLAVVAAVRAEALAAVLEAEGERVAVIGRVVTGAGVSYTGRL